MQKLKVWGLRKRKRKEINMGMCLVVSLSLASFSTLHTAAATISFQEARDTSTPFCTLSTCVCLPKQVRIACFLLSISPPPLVLDLQTKTDQTGSAENSGVSDLWGSLVLFAPLLRSTLAQESVPTRKLIASQPSRAGS